MIHASCSSIGLLLGSCPRFIVGELPQVYCWGAALIIRLQEPTATLHCKVVFKKQ